MKQEAVKRAMRRGTICPICRQRRATQIHHIMHGNSFNKALSEKYSNACLIYICGKCHERVHHTEKEDDKFKTLDYQLKVQAERDFAKYYPSEDWFNIFEKHYDIFGDEE